MQELLTEKVIKEIEMYAYEFMDFLDYIFSMKSSKDRMFAICLMAGMTQEEVALMANCTQPYVCKRLKKIKAGYKNIGLNCTYNDRCNYA